MSWFSIPLPNPFKSLQLSNNDNDNVEEEVEESQTGVVPSATGETIGRQFRAFTSPGTSNSGDDGSPSSRTFEGIRSDLEEIRSTFKSSLSIISNNRVVSEISKLASNFLQLNDQDHVNYVNNKRISNNDGGDNDDEEDHVVGINDEVVEFAQ